MNAKSFVTSVRNHRKRVAVVGDIIADEFHFGASERVSPEFPALVFNSRTASGDVRPGGAANVCHQLRHWNAETYLVGLLDDFSPEINTQYCVRLRDGKVPRKVRFYDHQQMPLPMRWDIESPDYGESDISARRKELLDSFLRLLKDRQIDVVVLSNYGKGVFDKSLAAKAIRECRARKIPVVVDPKGNPSWWVGCTVFKPNRREAFEMTWARDPEAQCQTLLQDVQCDSVVTTSPDKVYVQTAGGFSSYGGGGGLREVCSVVGAGDCFAAVLALGVAHGAPIVDASTLAYDAASRYVRSHLNRPVLPNELLAGPDAKIISTDDYKYVREHGHPSARVVFTNGCFDILHTGHLQLLQEAKRQGDILVVGVNDDKSVMRLKGSSRPVLSQYDRTRILASLDCVDFVILFAEDNPEELVRAVRPHVLVKGDDYKGKHVVGQDLVERLHFISRVHELSTTNIIEKIKSEK